MNTSQEQRISQLPRGMPVSRYLGGLHPWAGAAIAVAPAFAVFLQGGVYEVGVIALIGLSLVLIAALGHPGCEVLAFPALILGRCSAAPRPETCR